jgi:CheY-like chemotaxis protein
VLVIDDAPVVCDLLAGYLIKEGFQVKTAATGEEGLQLARAERPDVITLDVLMPEACADGWGILASLKTDPTLADIPVVMVTIVDDKNKGFALGASDYLTKPVNRERLAAIVNKYRRNAPAQSTAQANGNFPQTHAVGAPGPVLVVEDDEAAREILRHTLEQEDLEVIEAGDGRAALAQVASKRPELILLDLMLPHMDGFEFITQLRQNPDWQSIPIVIITGLDLTPAECQRLNGSIEQIFQKGAAGVNQEELLRRIRDQVRTCLRPSALA